MAPGSHRQKEKKKAPKAPMACPIRPTTFNIHDVFYGDALGTCGGPFDPGDVDDDALRDWQPRDFGDL